MGQRLSVVREIQGTQADYQEAMREQLFGHFREILYSQHRSTF